MLEQLLKVIEFPDKLNFELLNEVDNGKPSKDFNVYKLKSFVGHDYNQNWGYRAENNGIWVCLDINIKKDKFVDVISKFNDLLKSYKHDIIDVEYFKSDNYYLNPIQCECDDNIRIDFLNVKCNHFTQVESILSIQIVKFKTII